MNKTENIIETKLLTKEFFTSTRFGVPLFSKSVFTAVKNIDLTIKKGEVFGILGRNGAGKTTLIKILTTLIRPTSGSGKVNHFDICTKEDRVRKSIGFISNDERSFYWRLTGHENLIFFAALQGLNGERAKSRVSFLLNLVGLEKKKETQVQKYSAGMKQRLSIARGLLNNPPILFLDEPTKALDPFVSEEIRFFVRRELVEKREMTVLLATHNLTETMELCDSIAFMHAGEILARLSSQKFENEKRLKQLFMEYTSDDNK